MHENRDAEAAPDFGALIVMKAATHQNWLALLSFIVPAVGLPLFYGYMGRALHAPIIITTVLVGCWLWWGGRIGQHSESVVPSLIYGWPLAALIVFASYYLGRWLAL